MLPNSARDGTSPGTEYCPWSPTPDPSSLPYFIEPDESQEAHASIEPGESSVRPQEGSRNRRSYGRRIGKDQELLILKRCLQHTQSYENPEERKRKFWVIISKSLEADLGHLYAWNTIKKRVDDRVLERRVYLEQAKTGDPREPQTDLEAAIDEWIEVLDRIAAEVEETQAAARKARDDVARSSEYRDALTRRMGRKRDQTRILTEEVESLPTGLEQFEDHPREATMPEPEPEDFSLGSSPEPASAPRPASRSAMRSASTSTSRRASSSRAEPYPATRPRRSQHPRPDDDESQLLRRALIRVAEGFDYGRDSNQQERREMQQDSEEQRMRICHLERRIDAQERKMDAQAEKLDQILEILRGPRQ